MSKRQKKRRQRQQASRTPADAGRRREDRAREAITIAWTVSVTAVFLADIVTIAAYFYSRAHPESKTAPAFEAIMLLAASVMGAASLALLPVVWRVRTVKPPQGYTVFAAIVAAAPIVVTLARLVGP